MRAIAPLFLLCTLPGFANAQTVDQCPPTARAGDVLNCYNGTAPPHTLSKSKKSKPAVTANQPAAIENKKLDAKLKTLCRGC